MTFLEANGNSDNVTSDVFLPQIISPDTKFNGNTNGLAVVIDETNDLPITKTKSFDSTTATTVSDHASVKKIDDFDEYPHDAVRIENHPNSRPNEKKEGIEGYDMEPLEIDKSQKQNYDNDSYSYLQSTSSDETSYKINDHLKRTDALDSEREMFSRQSSCETVSNKMKDLAQYDNESKQILKLALPFATGEIIASIFEVMKLVIINKYIGTVALTSYVIAGTLLEMSDEFIGGIMDACTTIVPHCVGTGNNYLAGQYVQMTAILYLIASLPAAIFWWYYMYDAIIWFGFDDEIASLGESFTQIALVEMAISGLGETFELFLEVTGFETFSTVYSIVGDFVELAGFFILFHLKGSMTLIDLMYYDLGVSIVLSALIALIPISKGWIKEYLPGMFFNFALRNTSALKNLLNTALPLSIGSVLAYGEWELLTVFAAHMGRAEVAVWAILGTIWETFEATTEAIGDSAEVRVGYHLGKGDPKMAKMAADKSLFWGTCVGGFVTMILLVVGPYFSHWFSDEVIIQTMISDVIPLIGIGNVTMTFGMLCWSIIGAQGRYHLATCIALLTSWCVAIPAAAVMTYKLNYNLKGLVTSVVMGYSMTASCMSVVIIKTDWSRASQSIIAKNAVTGYQYSDSEYESRVSRESSISSASSGNSISSSDGSIHQNKGFDDLSDSDDEESRVNIASCKRTRVCCDPLNAEISKCMVSSFFPSDIDS